MGIRLSLSWFEWYRLLNNVYFELKVFSCSFFPFILTLTGRVIQVSPPFFSAGSSTFFSCFLCSYFFTIEGLMPIFSLKFWIFNSQSLKCYNAQFSPTWPTSQSTLRLFGHRFTKEFFNFIMTVISFLLITIRSLCNCSFISSTF